MRKLNKIDISDDVLLSLVKDKNIIEAGKCLGICGTSVIRLCRMRGIKIPNKSFLQKKFHIEKDKLEKFIKEKSILQIGKMFGVSDNAIRKRCKIMGIDYKGISKYSHGK